MSEARGYEEEIDKLREALKPFAAAYRRMRYYSDSEPSDDAPLFAEEDNCNFELLNGEEGPQVKVADLKNANDTLNEIP